GASAKAKVQNDSTWLVRLKTPKAGGPFELSVKAGSAAVTFKNVLLGEVWVCSGQSNMEMQLEGWPPKDTIWNSGEAIRTAANTNIRLFTVAKAFSNREEFTCTGRWAESSPETAAKFSAAAYYFGRKLNKDLKVPVGLISTSWGGTPVESWMSKNSLSGINEFKSVLENLASAKEEIRQLDAWLKGHDVIEIKDRPAASRWKDLDFRDVQCAAADYDDSRWTEMVLPSAWEKSPLGNFDGAGWFRKKIEIPSAWINKELVLELGPIDDMDETWVNGIKVGTTMEDGNWQVDRIYTVPANAVTDSVIVIAIRILDNQGGGGIYGRSEQMKIHPKDASESVSLAGSWNFLPVAELRDMKFYVFGAKNEEYYKRPKLHVDLSAYVPTALYNSMIAPLVPYTIKGSIWYQGESNTSNPELYKTLFPGMIKDWRTAWKQGDFSFYFVQIAPYNYGELTHSERLREAQMLTLSTPKTGMAVTLDIGNPNNIHPGNKKDVGERLALWALAKDYNKKTVYSGPVYKSMKIENDKITLTFDYADGGLVIKELAGDNNFRIAGKDGIFKKADVKVEGKKLIVSSTEVQEPLYVRYAWSNISEGTLFNKAGLPASSFRTDTLEDSKLVSK
ncbi:MAG: sialate O-acetylesterase, partial [Syntrophothermus sp.]